MPLPCTASIGEIATEPKLARSFFVCHTVWKKKEEEEDEEKEERERRRRRKADTLL